MNLTLQKLTSFMKMSGLTLSNEGLTSSFQLQICLSIYDLLVVQDANFLNFLRFSYVSWGADRIHSLKFVKISEKT